MDFDAIESKLNSLKHSVRLSGDSETVSRGQSKVTQGRVPKDQIHEPP